MKTHQRLSVAGIIAVAVSFGLGAYANVAAPRIIMFYGPPLQKSIFMTNWKENLDFLLSMDRRPDITVGSLKDRPSIKVALFWFGPKWEPFTKDTSKLAQLNPSDAETRGRLYPAVDTAGAILEVETTGVISRLRPRALEILSAHGVAVAAPGVTQPH